MQPVECADAFLVSPIAPQEDVAMEEVAYTGEEYHVDEESVDCEPERRSDPMIIKTGSIITGTYGATWVTVAHNHFLCFIYFL